MERKYIPFEKLSKKKRRELNSKRRRTWGGISPVTRRPDNPKAYNRQKARRTRREDENCVPFFTLFTDFCGIRKRPLVCHCERLYGARQSVLLLVHLCTTGVTDRRA